MSKKGNKYSEWECPNCSFMTSGASKNVVQDKQLHLRLGCDMEIEPVAATPEDYAAVEQPEPIVQPAPVVVEIVPVATMPQEMHLDELRQLFTGLADGIGESVEKSRKLAEREHKTYLQIVEIESMIKVMRDEVLPQLMSVPAGYRDDVMIEAINQKIATGVSQLALKKSKKQFARAAKAAKEIEVAAQKRIRDLQAECSRMNQSAEHEAVQPHVDRFDAMQERLEKYLDGTIHIPTKSGGFPFMRDLCWKTRSYHKQFNDADWSQSVEAAISECLERVSIYDVIAQVTVPVYQIDNGMIVSKETTTVNVELLIDRNKIARLQKKIVDKRGALMKNGLKYGDAEDQAIRDLKLWGSGDAIEEMFFNPGNGYQPKGKKEHQTNMGQAIREAMLSKDNPEANQS